MVAKKRLVAAFTALACTAAAILAFLPKEDDKFIYKSSLGFSFEAQSSAEITELDGGLSVEDGNVLIKISVSDAYDDASEECREHLEREKLNLESGAYNSNYFNYAYVTKLFGYLLGGSQNEYVAVGITKTTLGKNDAMAYYSQFCSEDESKCGYIFETVQKAKCYIIVVYINDEFENIFNYNEAVRGFVEGIEF